MIVPLVNVVQYGYNYKWAHYDCCGTPMEYPLNQLGTCQYTKLIPPDGLDQLLAISRHEELLVATCDGFLRPFSTGKIGAGTTPSWSPDSGTKAFALQLER